MMTRCYIGLIWMARFGCVRSVCKHGFILLENKGWFKEIFQEFWGDMIYIVSKAIKFEFTDIFCLKCHIDDFITSVFLRQRVEGSCLKGGIFVYVGKRGIRIFHKFFFRSLWCIIGFTPTSLRDR